ncbi:MAG: hydroxyethylthiazole kinase [Methanobrevibacter sp.]|mgnify:FL=1|uniref:hydroxyethylthiazole kinase n=1 Tax=Methanobrevibacter TaxID=2172 RepID=UPI0015B8989D|nr:hydroxyethylthiazole kinase [Methanobrevibacter gottschalkii]MBS7257291.1 hydroxyethylthiazole kinase [Methanobrevibacter sp.]MCI7429250.1 hydroxyethylthiazole kinase [Methanobrevibacter sp.]
MTNNETELLNNIEKNLTKIKQKNALTHCITNSVTINDCANAILAIGGSPFMAEDAEELEEVVSISDALVINIGKLSKTQIEAMEISCETADKTNTPIILDPVGVGVTQLRNKVTMDLIEKYNISAIRGNISEIKAIAKLANVLDESNAAKGVDVNEADIITPENLKANGEIICALASKLNTTILASGPIDILSDGKLTIAIDNGDEMMPLITGSGCMLSSIVGTCIGSTTPLEGCLVAILAMNIAGEKARAKVDEKDEGTGSFRAYLIDYLYQTNSTSLINKANIKIL